MPRDPEQQAIADWLETDEGWMWRRTVKRESGIVYRHAWIELKDDDEDCWDGESHDNHRHCWGWRPNFVRHHRLDDGSCPLYSAEYRKAKADA